MTWELVKGIGLGLAAAGLLLLLGLARVPPAHAVPSPGGEMCAKAEVMQRSLAARGFVLPRGALNAPPGTVIEIIRGRRRLTLFAERRGVVCTGGVS